MSNNSSLPIEQIYAPFPAYQGDGKYVFVSYAHSDRDRVFPIIKRLYEARINLWYDEGISIQVNYHEAIARAIAGCDAFLIFISEKSVNSTFVIENELRYAITNKKRIVPVFLDNVALPPAAGMMLGAIQCLHFSEHLEEHIISKLSDFLQVYSDRNANDIFLSYRHLDRKLAEEFISELSARGFNVWDDSKLTPGRSFDVEIKEQIENSRTVVVLLTKNSIESTFFPLELQCALLNKKKIIPVFVDLELGDLPASLAIKLSNTNSLHLKDADSNEIHKAIEQIDQVVRPLISKKPRTDTGVTVSPAPSVPAEPVHSGAKSDEYAPADKVVPDSIVPNAGILNTEKPKMVFISYAHTDVNTGKIDVQALADGIRLNCGCNPWFDANLTGGRNFNQEIAEKIDCCDIVVWLLSENSATSSYVNDEIGYAKNNGKEVIPCVLANEPIPAIQGARFSNVHRLEYQLNGSKEPIYSSIRAYLNTFEPTVENASYIEGLIEADSQGKTKEIVSRIRNLALLAKAYRTGEYGAEQNIGRAFVFSGLAAFCGDTDAMYYHGCFMDDGVSIDIDEKGALELFAKAADRGHAEAMCKVGDYFREKEDYIAASAKYEAALSKDCGMAALRIGEMYQKAQGRPESDTDAIKYYTKALELNEPEAVQITLQLAQAYTYGRGGRKKDIALGGKCYRALAMYGDQFSAYEYAELLRKGMITEDEHDATFFYSMAAKSDDSKLAKKASQRIKALNKAK